MRSKLVVVTVLALIQSGCAAGFRAGGGNGVDAGVAVGPPVVVQYPPQTGGYTPTRDYTPAPPLVPAQ